MTHDPTKGRLTRLLADPVALDGAIDLVNATMLNIPTLQRQALLQIQGRELKAVQALVVVVAVLLGRRPGRSRVELYEIRDRLRMALFEETFARETEGDDHG